MLIQLRIYTKKPGQPTKGGPGENPEPGDYGVEYGIVTVTRVLTGLPFLMPGL